MKNTITAKTYNKTLAAIRARIEKGRVRMEDAFRREAMETNWEVGRMITEDLLPDSVERPSAANARMVRKLSAALKKSRTLIYAMIRFYQCYPRLPQSNLTWSHYKYLSYVDDERARRALEATAIRKGHSSERLYELINVRELEAQKKAEEILLKETAGICPSIPVARGELYYYRCLRRDYITVKKNERLVDIGFKMLRKVKTPAWKSRSHVLYIRSYKKDGAYNVRIANPPDEDKLYTYVATVQRVVDGDTLFLNIDLGFDSWVQEKVRLRGIDAPERTTNLGKIAKRYVRKTLDGVKFVVVKTYKDDKYGRMLTDVFYATREKAATAVAAKGTFLNQQLLDEGLAKVWEK